MDQFLEEFIIELDDKEEEPPTEQCLEIINKLETRFNVAATNQKFNENQDQDVFTSDMDEILSNTLQNIELKLATAVIKNIFLENSPVFEQRRIKLHVLLTQFRNKDAQLANIREKSSGIRQEIVDIKMSIKEAENDLLHWIEEEKLRRSQESMLNSKYENYRLKVEQKAKDAEMNRCLALELIVNLVDKYDKDSELIEFLGRLRKPISL